MVPLSVEMLAVAMVEKMDALTADGSVDEMAALWGK
jgi:hypothetical protein